MQARGAFIVKSAINERKPMQRAIRPYSNVDAALTHINNHNSATMPK
ncbi:hypothetical protein [Hoylesella loescheii]|nr:hypothetical protein [Hoylesella loescheii]